MNNPTKSAKGVVDHPHIDANALYDVEENPMAFSGQRTILPITSDFNAIPYLFVIDLCLYKYTSRLYNSTLRVW